MRILTLTNMYPPHLLGGYELSCWDVMRRFEARGHEVHVLTTDMRLGGVDEGREQRVDRALRFYWDDHELLSPPLLTRLAIERHNQRQLRRLLESFQPDVVSVWNMGAMSLGLLTTLERRRLPLVVAVCDDWLVYGPNLDAWTRLFRSRPRAGRVVAAGTRVPTRLPRLADAAFCFVSDFTRRRAQAEAWPGLSIDVDTVVYSGIDRADFPPVPATEREWRWRILYVGRIDDRKGIETLVDAMALLPAEATLDILGRGGAAYLDSLRDRVRRRALDDRVRFDAADRSELHSVYTAADVFVFPSEWDEPFGLVPVEAMSCGTPVVATGTGGSGEFLRDGVNCVRYPPGDAAKLAAAVGRLAESPALRARVVAGGTATAAELDADRLAEVFEAWHVAAAERFAHGAPPDRALDIPTSVDSDA